MTRRRKAVLLAVAAVVVLGLAYLIYKRLTAEEEGGRGERPAQVTVAIEPVRGVTFTRTIEGVGDILASEAVIVTAEAAGRVAAINFQEGANVPAGAVLVRLDAAQEQADVQTRIAEANELRGRLGRLQRLVGEGAVPRGDVADLGRTLQAANARTESARTVLEDTSIRAPFSGTLGLRQVSVGAYVQPGTELVTLDRIDSVKLRFTMPEAVLGRVRVGSPIEVTSQAFGNQVFRGRISAFASRLNTDLRTITAEARLPNPGQLLRPGMLANVRVNAETVSAAVIPPIALQVRGPTHFVYRIDRGCAIRAEVRIGQRKPDGVEVLEGLKPGDRVATEGFDNLSSGTPVIDKRVARQQARGGEKGSEKGSAKAKGKEKSGEEKEREQALTQRCQAIAGQAGGGGGGSGAGGGQARGG